MTAAAIVVWRLSVRRFHKIHEASLTHADAIRAMEAGVAA